MPNEILSIKNLKVELALKKNKCYPVNDVTFSLLQGETLGIVGESGSGKSMTAYSIMGLLPEGISTVHATEFKLLNNDLTSFSEKEYRKIRGKEVSIIFQDPMSSLNPYIKIGKQITEPLLLHSKVSKKDAKQEAISILNKVGIGEAESCFNRFPYEFSGGMQQRIMIAMALITKPKVLIADEPTTALDVTVQAQVLKLLKDLQSEYKMSMIFISHDLGVISQMSNNIAVMYGGRVMEYGTSKEILHNPSNPYTQMLKKSIPSIDGDKNKKLATIPGLPPSILEKQEGCPFADRCFKSSDLCRNTKNISYQNISNTHLSYCYLK